MMNPWTDRERRLWWKELRESYPVVLLGVIVILIMMIKLPLTGASRAWWGMGFHMEATAILFFVSLVLGVTAYAVEIEYETMEHLFSRPIPANDILATKLGVRLGLLFISMCVIGLVELWTGAWPIVYNTPSTPGFMRWLNSLSLLFMGLGLGFYFGKALGRQITALLAAILVFAACWVLMVLSPLAMLFQGDEGTRLLWIRDILLPAIVGTAVIAASIRTKTGEGGPIPRPLAAAIALTLYALVFFSQTVAEPGYAWKNPRIYRAHWTARFGSPAAALDALLYEYKFLRVPNHAEIGPDSLRVRMIKDTNLGRSAIYESPEQRIPTWIYGVYNPGYAPPPLGFRGSVEPYSPLERETARKRSSRWIGRVLEIAGESLLSEAEQMYALHLAGVAGHPEHTEIIASFLESPHQGVQLMAADVLLARSDPRGPGKLSELTLQIRRNSILENIARTTYSWQLHLGSELEPLMSEWALSWGTDYLYRRRAARAWYLKNGSPEDLELIRMSLWLEKPEIWRETRDPDEIEMWEYFEAWDAPGWVESLNQRARDQLDELTGMYPRHQELSEKRRITGVEQIEMNHYRGLVRSLENKLMRLVRVGDASAIDLWKETRTLMQEHRWIYYWTSFLGYLPRLGEPGVEFLKEMVADNKAWPTHRLQAALILVYYNHDEYIDFVLDYSEIYKDSRRWLTQFAEEAFADLIREGYLIFAGPLIENSWARFQNGKRHRGLGTWYFSSLYWKDRHARILEEATGKKYGWDLKKWKKWWDREGRALASSMN